MFKAIKEFFFGKSADVAPAPAAPYKLETPPTFKPTADAAPVEATPAPAVKKPAAKKVNVAANKIAAAKKPAAEKKPAAPRKPRTPKSTQS